MLKIFIGDDAPDLSVLPTPATTLREAPPVPANWQGLKRRTFTLQRSGSSLSPEIEWLINDHAFDP